MGGTKRVVRHSFNPFNSSVCHRKVFSVCGEGGGGYPALSCGLCHLNNRRDQSVFNRCRIGHSRLTPEFLLKGEPPL